MKMNKNFLFNLIRLGTGMLLMLILLPSSTLAQSRDSLDLNSLDGLNKLRQMQLRNLDAYLQDPKALIPGNKMAFPIAGMKVMSDKQRKNLIEFLKSLK